MTVRGKVLIVTVVAALAVVGVVRVRSRVERDAAPAYQVQAQLDPDQKLLTGRERVTWTNTTYKWQSTVFLRTYGVDPTYGPVKITDMKAGTRPVAFTLERTLVRVSLARPLAPGASVDLEWSFEAKLPERYDPVSYTMIYNSDRILGGSEYGVHRQHGVVTLTDAFPRVLQAPADGSSPRPERYWDPPLNSSWAVELIAPAGWTIVSNGAEEREEALADGRVRWHMASDQAPSFSMVAGKDLQKTTRVTAGTTVNVYHPAAVRATGEDAADRAVAALNLYADRFGPLFDSKVDLVAIPFRQYAGMYQSGGLILLSQGLFSDQTVEKEPKWVAEPALAPLAKVDVNQRRAVVVYHEMAHGYWAGVVDGNPVTAPWVLEGMAEWSTLYALEQLDGAAAAEAEREQKQLSLQVAMARGEKDGPLRQSSSWMDRSGQYYKLYYDKGALFLDGLRRRTGDEAFLNGVRQVLTQYRGRVMPDDEPVQAILNAAGNTPELKAYAIRWLDWEYAREDLGPLPESVVQLVTTP